MNCPKCNEAMQDHVVEGIEVDRCPACEGVWLDKGETEQILSQKLGHTVDPESFKEIPAGMDQKPATCRACQKPMMAMTGMAGVRFEYCTQCKCMFFDRGELATIQAKT